MNPLILTSSEAQAMADGTKLAHVFVMEPQPDYWRGDKPIASEPDHDWIEPPHRVGDILYVAEPFAINCLQLGWCSNEYLLTLKKPIIGGEIIYRAEGDWKDQFEQVSGSLPPWREPHNMPEWAARTRLKVVSYVAVRAQSVTGTMKMQCGFKTTAQIADHASFRDWLNSTQDGAYDKNEYLWFVEMERVK